MLDKETDCVNAKNAQNAVARCWTGFYRTQRERKKLQKKYLYIKGSVHYTFAESKRHWLRGTVEGEKNQLYDPWLKPTSRSLVVH